MPSDRGQEDNLAKRQSQICPCPLIRKPPAGPGDAANTGLTHLVFAFEKHMISVQPKSTGWFARLFVSRRQECGKRCRSLRWGITANAEKRPAASFLKGRQNRCY